MEKRYWPEFLGIGLTVAVMGITATGYRRLHFGLPYQMWRRFHRLLTAGVIAGATIHILFVSDGKSWNTKGWRSSVSSGMVFDVVTQF